MFRHGAANHWKSKNKFPVTENSNAIVHLANSSAILNPKSGKARIQLSDSFW
jgi:hypothetical protein